MVCPSSDESFFFGVVIDELKQFSVLTQHVNIVVFYTTVFMNVFDASGEGCVREGGRGHRDRADLSGGENERLRH